jgi:hypothetical protein
MRPRSEDQCKEWGVEYVWDMLGWDMYENPRFVHFPEHPEWNDAEVNRLIKADLETRAENAAQDWWQNNMNNRRRF